MGCEKSKPASKGNMVRPDRAPGKSGPKEEVNSTAVVSNNRSGMDNRQVFSIKQSWKAISRNLEFTGMEMFIALFNADKKLQHMFQEFKDIRSDDELRSNEALEAHATLVMTTLDEAIVHIDNYDYVQSHLYKVAASHIRFPGFQPDTFLAMKEPFLEAVRLTLGDRYTDNMKNIYGLAITFVLQTMVDGMNEALKKEGDSNANGSAKKTKND